MLLMEARGRSQRMSWNEASGDQVSARFEGNMTTNARNDDKGKPLDPYDALGALQASDDLSVALDCRPEVSQPYIDFDERGRLWLTSIGNIRTRRD